MGMIRENGYRVYDSKYKPGRDGRSNLLFDDEGALSGHADFHVTDREESSDASAIPDEVVDLIVKVFAAAGAVAVSYLAARGVRRAVLNARAKRAEQDAAAESTTELEAGEQAAVLVAGEDLESPAPAEELDADDLLIEEIHAVIEDSRGSVQDYQDRRAVAVEQSTVDDARATRLTKRRSTRG